jgi:hypothetical protein
MVSEQTLTDIIHVVQNNVDDFTFRKIVLELREVRGNKSFRDTVEALHRRVEKGRK